MWFEFITFIVRKYHYIKGRIKYVGLINIFFSILSYILIFGTLIILILYTYYNWYFICDYWYIRYQNLLMKIYPPVIIEPDPSKQTIVAEEPKVPFKVSKKTIIIGVTITAVVVCGVGVGVLFIPGVPECIIGTVVALGSSGGFGGA